MQTSPARVWQFGFQEARLQTSPARVWQFGFQEARLQTSPARVWQFGFQEARLQTSPARVWQFGFQEAGLQTSPARIVLWYGAGLQTPPARVVVWDVVANRKKTPKQNPATMVHAQTKSLCYVITTMDRIGTLWCLGGCLGGSRCCPSGSRRGLSLKRRG